MSLNQQVALILTSKDATKTGFDSAVRGLLGLGGQAQKTQQALVAYQKISNSLALTIRDVGIKSDITASSNNKLALAQQRYNLSVQQGIALSQKQAAMTAQAARENLVLAEANTKLQASEIALDRARNNKANALVTQRRATRAFNSAGATLATTNTPAANEAFLRAEEDLEKAKRNTAIATDNLTLSEDKLQVVQLQQIESIERIQSLNSLTMQQNNQMIAQNIRVAASQQAVTDTKTAQNAASLAESRARNTEANLRTDLTGAAAAARPGAFGSLAAAATGPVGLAAITTGIAASIVGVMSSKAATAFQGTEVQVAAQTNTPLKDVIATGNAALKYAQTGKSLFSPSQEVQGSLLLDSLHLSQSVVTSLIKPLAQSSAIIKAPNEDLIGKALVTMIGQNGGASTTTGQAKGFLNQIVGAEQNVPAPPSALTAAIPKLFASTSGAGISSQDLLAMEVQLTRATGASPSVTAGWIGQLVRASIIKPTPAAVKLASGLGLSLGKKAFDAVGDNPEVYFSRLMAGIQNDPQLAAVLFSGGGGGSGINAMKAAQGLALNGGWAKTAQLSDQFAKSGGVLGNAASTLQLGIQQQEAELGNRFNADLIKIGQTINDKVMPSLLALAEGALSAGEGLVGVAGGAGGWIDKHIPGGTAKLFQDAFLAIPGNPVAAYKAISGISNAIAAASSTGPTPLQLNANRGLNVPTSNSQGGVYDFRTHKYVYPGGRSTPLTPGISPIYDRFNQAISTPRFAETPFAGTSGGLPGFNNLGFLVGKQQGVDRNQTPDNSHGIGGLISLIGRGASALGGINPGAVLGNITQAAKIADYEQGAEALKKFNAALAQFNVDASASSPNLNKLNNEANALKKMLKDPALGGPTGLLTGKQITTDEGKLDRITTKLSQDKAVNAANVNYNAAVIFAQSVSDQGLGWKTADAAATKVYNTAVALAVAQQKAGQLPKGETLETLKNKAKNTELTSFGQNLQKPMAEAQAGLSLAQATGTGIAGAQAAVIAMFRQEFKDKVIGPNELAYDIYQTKHSGITQQQGPQLVRPNQIPDSMLNVAFGASAARLSAARNDPVNKQLAYLESLVQSQATELANQRQTISELRLQTAYARQTAQNTAPRKNQGGNPGSVPVPPGIRVG